MSKRTIETSEESAPLLPPTSTNKSLWKRWWFWGVLVAILAVIGSLAGPADTDSPLKTVANETPSSLGSVDAVQRVEVPDLVGLSLPKARSRAQPSGLEIEVAKKYSNQTAGTVLSIAPLAGTQVEAGSALRLVVAMPLPRIPNVVGENLKSARRALEARGFKVEVRRQTSSQRNDTVISQSPTGRTEARPGRTVTLVVAKPPPSTAGGGADCTSGYSPCLLVGPSDYDCYGGSGDGPAYTQPGVVYQVSGSDPYGLDADNDGLGCE